MTYQKAVTSTQYYDDIAKAIRENHYLGLSYTPSEMANGVYAVAEYKYNDGHEMGLMKGVDQGRQAQYDEFWDDFQSKGAVKSYMRYFQGAGWSDKTFNPNYDIVTTNLQATFYGNNRITRIPVLVDISRVTNSNYTSQSFYGCSSLTSLSLKVAETTPWNLNTFQTCSALENLTIDGTIGMNNFDLHWSTQLSDVSLLSILTACNKSAAGLSITLPTTAETKIKNSTELSTAATNAGNNGYTILYD